MDVPGACGPEDRAMNGSRSGQDGWLAVSGFFGDAGAAREALMNLLSLGVPRDLIEVVVDKRDAAKLFGKGPRRAFDSTTSAAGKGALSGLILSTFASAAMIAFSNIRDDERLTWIMLLGPNLGVMLGGFAGLWWGALKPKPMPVRYARVREREGILMIARSRTEEDARMIMERMRAQGAREIRIQ